MIVRSIAGGVEILAPAKLNLFLEVLGSPADGYHEIESLMVAVNLYDTLTFHDDPSGEIRLRCNDPALPVGCAESGGEGGRAPEGVGALPTRGADRARQGDPGTRQGWAAVRAMRRRRFVASTGSGISGRRRRGSMSLAGEIGSDVAFFTHAPAAVCRGTGGAGGVEVPLEDDYHFVLVCPPVGMSTADVYRQVVPPERPRPIGPILEALGTRWIGRTRPEPV